MESLAEQLDVRGVQLALSGKHFGHYALSAEIRRNVPLSQAMLRKEKPEHAGR
jgi:hypothetical protein